ncbi:leucine Rich repeat-containing domain protein [Teladorsagia circumcincta]|uniref:Leucine Rich repeat-containing domain protein n=1 Tax=Teladorsagia circumcincta TaxID=45464 RepID=A0A2G9UH70_TELCI|nr:leucine Rich repeat-containing domain protein [Teladorsagia circumcincta]
MDTLNRDCLSLIFLNLDFIERVRLEHVCRMFHYVLQDSLSFLPTVVGVIERCGPYVQQLSFGQRWLRISQPIIDCIADNCKQLCVVDLGAVILSADLSPLLEKIAPQLQEFSLEETSWVNIEFAEKVQNHFKSMKKLRKLNLRSAMFQLTRLAELPTSLQYLEIGGAHSFPSEILLEFLQNHDRLEEFHASPVPVLDDGIINAIGSLPNLRHLSLGHSYNADLPFDQLGNLTKLESLRMNDVYGLTEVSLQLILSRMANLERISLINCKNVFDYTSLGNCGRLQSLEIRNTMQLANEDILALCSYGNLKRLVLSNCFNFSSRGVNIALMRCQLKELTVNKCARVTDEMMYTLASTQRELESISIQECSAITRYEYNDTSLQKLVMYIFDTSISRAVEQEPKDLNSTLTTTTIQVLVPSSYREGKSGQIERTHIECATTSPQLRIAEEQKIELLTLASHSSQTYEITKTLKLGGNLQRKKGCQKQTCKNSYSL